VNRHHEKLEALYETKWALNWSDENNTTNLYSSNQLFSRSMKQEFFKSKK
jgi:hypothetical protein